MRRKLDTYTQLPFKDKAMQIAQIEKGIKRDMVYKFHLELGRDVLF